jgi:hypothetical protein
VRLQPPENVEDDALSDNELMKGSYQMRPIIVLKTNDKTITVSRFFSSEYRPDKPPDELPSR